MDWIESRLTDGALRERGDGDDELLTEAAQVAGMIADRLPEVKGAPVVWPKAANGSR